MKQQNIAIEEELREARFAGYQQIKTNSCLNLEKQSLEVYNQIRKNPFQLSQEFHENELKCKLCKDYYIKFTIAQCGHSFCYYCIFEHLLKSHVCFQYIQEMPMLPQHFERLTIHLLIANCFKIINPYSTEKGIQRMEKKKKLTNFKLGDSLDILDTEHIWCVGQIINIRNQKEMLVHYKGWDKVYDEYISISSPRLSPLGLFTDRTDILLYQSSPNDNAMSNYIRQIEENDQLNYLILQQQTSNSNIILAIESPTNNTLSSLLQLVVIIREIHDEFHNDS